jgi:hypothetical protein
MKKWDQRYFVATTARLYYFKTMDDFKRGNVHPSGVIVMKDHVVEPTPSNCEFVLRGADRTYRFKADDEGMAHRWITALRAVQISSMAEWSTREMVSFGRMVGFPEEFLKFLMANNMDGNGFARLKTSAQLAEKRYLGRTDTIWTLLNNLRTPDVHDWLARFSAFCQKNASERPLENAEMLCLIRLGKGLEVMNSLDKPEETTAKPPAASPRQLPPQQRQPQYTPAPVTMAPAPYAPYSPVPDPHSYEATVSSYGGDPYEDDDGPVADDV